jgi:predicted glutamine amidotransferase
MARLFAYLANRPDVGSKVIESASSIIDHSSAREPMGWGAGFYQGGEVLLRRRPVDERSTLPIAASLADLRTTVLLGHVRSATVGSLSTENTHPFRYRQWLFAHTGTIPSFAAMRQRLIESIPQFLMRNVRGDTDSELLFHLFLSFLHDTGNLDRLEVNPSDARGALRSTVALLDRLCAEEGAGPCAGNMIATDGENIVAFHGSDRMAYRTYQGRHDFDGLLGDEGPRRRVPDIDTARVYLLVADYDGDSSGFTPVPERSILTLTRATDPTVEPLLSAGARARALAGLPRPRDAPHLPHHRPLGARPPPA